MHCLDDIPRIPSTSKPAWVCVADPNNPFTTLSKASQAWLQWLGSCLKHSPVQPLAKQPRLQALAAADACAEEEVVGIGGWAVTASQMVWFAETWLCRMSVKCGPALSSRRSVTSRASKPWRSQRSRLRIATLEAGATLLARPLLFTTSWPLQVLCAAGRLLGACQKRPSATDSLARALQ